MSETTNSNQPQVIHPPYEFALSLVVIHQNEQKAEGDRDIIADLWNFESLGEAEHISLEDAQASNVPFPKGEHVFPITLVYDKDLDEGYENPVYTSYDLAEVRSYIQNFESNFTTKN